jgi:hypothetical protein
MFLLPGAVCSGLAGLFLGGLGRAFARRRDRRLRLLDFDPLWQRREDCDGGRFNGAGVLARTAA